MVLSTVLKADEPAPAGAVPGVLVDVPVGRGRVDVHAWFHIVLPFAIPEGVNPALDVRQPQLVTSAN